MKRFFIIFAVAMLFASCSQNYNELKLSTIAQNETKMTQEERARKVVMDMLNRIDPQTRGSVRKIVGVEFISFEQMFGGKSRTESDSIDLSPNPTRQPGFIIVDFEDSTGFAVVAPFPGVEGEIFPGIGNEENEDSDAVGLLAITDSGNLTTEEVLSYGDEWTNNSSGNSSEESDSIYTVGEADPDTFVSSLLYSYAYNITYSPDYYSNLPEDEADMDSVNDVALESKGPIVGTKWNQYYPFNARVETISEEGTRCPVGCTVIATAQVLTYFANKDLSWFFGVTNSTWSTFRNTDFSNSNSSTPLTTAESDVSKFTKEIADGIGVSYKRKDSGSGVATPRKMNSYLKNDLLYSVDLNWFGRKAKRLLQIVNSINNNKPVIISAGNSEVFLGGHSWIIDGYMQNENSNSDKRDYYLHCNYGWGGKSDGWYFIDLFHDEENDNELLDDTSIKEHSFDYNYMFSYIFFN